MGDSRKHLLNSIDIAFSLYRSRSDSAIPEEELQQLEADLKSEPFLKFLESVFSATFTSRTHWEDKLWELAAHYPIEYLNRHVLTMDWYAVLIAYGQLLIC